MRVGRDLIVTARVSWGLIDEMFMLAIFAERHRVSAAVADVFLIMLKAEERSLAVG